MATPPMMLTREPSSTGLEPHVAATAAYLAGPFSGVLILLAERTSRDVRFHAWQSIVGLGGLGVIVVLLALGSGASMLVSATAFRVLLIACWLVWILWIVCWGLCLYNAFRRRRWRLPIAGDYADRLAGPSAT